MKGTRICTRHGNGNLKFVALLAALLLCLLPGELTAQDRPPGTSARPITAPIDVDVPVPPVPFQGDEEFHLAYELHISNLGKSDCTLTKIAVVGNQSDSRRIANFTEDDLAEMIVHPGQNPAAKTKIGPGSFAVVYMWVTSARRESIPSAIRHRISMKVDGYSEEITVETPPTPVAERKPIVIDPPLTGGEWQAGNGPSNKSIHRRALIPIDGRAYISQRFAIDWVQLYPDGKTYNGDPAGNRNYRDYGAEIHAVADGVVTQVKDGIPQNTPTAKTLAVPITLETVGGNHVIEEIEGGVYAFYAHMQTGSVRVKVGDKVNRGEVLGLLGNSGNSSEPHLHFHICNANSELGCEGLPYAFPSYEIQGKGEGWKLSESSGAPKKEERAIPLEDDVVRFPAFPQKNP